jgi:hypothetical protein
MDLGERKTPFGLPTYESLDWYVEPLREARAMRGKRRVSARPGWAGEKSDFFSFLLVESHMGSQLVIVE